MRSILYIAFLAIAAAGCHSPEKTTGTDMASPPAVTSDSSTMSSTPSGSAGSTTDTVATTPVDTTGSKPMSTDSTTNK